MTLLQELHKYFPDDRILSRAIDRIAYASDASFYRLIPRAIVLPKTVEEVRALFAVSQSQKVPLTFRSAGTSLSGQAVTEGLLVETARNWKKIWIEDEGLRVRVQPGVIADHINQRLAGYNRRIGPDPSSIASATIGGILANNSGGKSVSPQTNAYGTLQSISFVLPNGFTLNSGSRQAEQSFLKGSPEIARGLLNIKSRIESDPSLVKKIQRKFQMRNTMGYSLNAFLDFKTPLEILAHLLIGSEGTLGFISEAVLRTIPIDPLKYTGLLFFENLDIFGAAVEPLVKTDPQVLEIMDRRALKNVQEVPGVPGFVRALPDTAVALLIEYQCADPDAFSAIKDKASEICSQLTLLPGSGFTEDPQQGEIFWKVRTPVVPATFARHPRGTIAQIEDFIVPVHRVAELMADLHGLFKRHEGCEDMVIFGHLTFGNVHFIITPGFNADEEIRRYERLMNAVINLVLNKYDGALKGEHATGRNMAPYLAAEWGPKAYQVMRDIKRLIDPENLLNPGVIINSDPKANLRNLKPLARIEPEVDLCIECGHCEWACPSRDLTLSPRQRIVVRREIKRLQESGNNQGLLKELISDYQYDGIDTCAADGLCAVACPVNIDTGVLTRRLRAEAISPRGQWWAAWLSRHFSGMEAILRTTIKMGHFIGTVSGEKTINRLVGFAEKIFSLTLPKWNATIRRPHTGKLPHTEPEGAEVVYFPGCLSRVMGTSQGSGRHSMMNTFLALAERARISVWLPKDSRGLCCGMPFHSKGYSRAYREMVHRTIIKFWEWSQGGRLPLFTDSSSCAYALRSCGEVLEPDDFQRWSKMTILDPIEFIHDRLLPRLEMNRPKRSVVLHPSCGAVKLELEGKLKRIARQCARTVTVPVNHSCCGYAGDRGLLFPELTASATRDECSELLGREYDGYYSTNLPCEMGLSKATGEIYESIAYLLEEASREL